MQLAGRAGRAGRQVQEERVKLLLQLETCGKVTYLLDAVQDWWQEEEGGARRAWLAKLGLSWSTVLYGEEHEDATEWRSRLLHCRKEL